jgi:hypothetical protein
LELMRDLELSLTEDLLDEVAHQAPAGREDAIRRMREKLLAIKLLAQTPPAPPPRPTWWQTPEFWRTAIILALTIAALLGVKIPSPLNP